MAVEAPQKSLSSTANTAADAAPSKRHVSVSPWVEKYRPKTVDDVAFQDEVVNMLKKCIGGGDLPHLLFYGPPGTGKTSTILAVSRQLFGPELLKTRVLELNASDERGIKVIREKVKTFAQTTSHATVIGGVSIPQYKIVILDEADSMTSDAQTALRRTMENYSKTTRFCLICNYISRIIEPLTSRCAKFRFKPLDSAIVEQRLALIASLENVHLSAKALERIIQVSGGDLRRAITLLQSAHRLCLPDASIQEDDVVDIAGVAPSSIIELIFSAATSNSYEKLFDTVKETIAQGFAADQVINQFFEAMLTKANLSDEKKALIAQRIAQVDKCLIDGADEFLQLMDLFVYCMTLFAQK